MNQLLDEDFRAACSRALAETRKILDTTRNPVLPSASIPHHYRDKFVLAEHLTRAGAAAVLSLRGPWVMPLGPRLRLWRIIEAFRSLQLMVMPWAVVSK